MRSLFISAAVLVAFVSASSAQEVTTLRPLTTHVLGATSTSAVMTQAVSSQTTWVRIYTINNVHVAFGGSTVTAAATDSATGGSGCCYSDMLLPAQSVEYFRISRGEYIAVIRDTTDGEVFITEMTK